jgi:hypothetical protein
MVGHAGDFTGRVLVGALGLTSCLTVSAMAAGVSPPNFSHADIGWYVYNRQFIPPASGPGPVRQDPERPYVLERRVPGQRKAADRAARRSQQSDPSALGARCHPQAQRAGARRKPANPPHASCWPVGVPGFI